MAVYEVDRKSPQLASTAGYPYDARPRARHTHARCLQVILQVDYLRLFCSVSYNRLSVGKDRGQHYVFSGAHTGVIKLDVAPFQPVGLAVYEPAMRVIYLRAHVFKRFQVQVDRSRAYFAPTRVRNFSGTGLLASLS